MSHLENQVVLITGCSSGIGRSLAREFARRGHRTFATARRPETLNGLGGERLEAVRLDVTDPASIEEAVGSTLERAGRIDVLVNNAASTSSDRSLRCRSTTSVACSRPMSPDR
jgi:NAD(P)-dependent dehydrogenase (short-subunit alcohol dehydrogenase family)